MEARIVQITEKYLAGLNRSHEIAQWAIDNSGLLDRHIAGFDELAEVLNNVPNNSPLLEIMPKTKKLKTTLSGDDIPTIAEMSDGNFALGLMNAREPMLHGQKIKTGEIATPTVDDKSFAIGTPSMDTSTESLAIGTAGHLIERTFFKYEGKKGKIPEGGWRKDDYLQSLDEGLMLALADGEKPHLTDFFTKSNAEGGLGWLKEQKITDFSDKLNSL